jgi:exopolysaccharide biosynthesis polyprenyl glycosylphosphotransferase
VLAASFILAFGTMSFVFLARMDVSRLFLVALLAAQPVVTIAERLAIRLFLERLRARGYNQCQMIILGIHAEAQAFANAVEGRRELGIEVIGHLRAHGEIDSAVTRPILGDAEDLARIFHERIVDEVAICVAPRAGEWAAPLISLAAAEGKHVRVPSRLPVRAVGLQTEELDGWLVRSHVNSPAHYMSLAVKRFIDLVSAALGLVVLSPVFLLVAVAITIRDGRPVLFHQRRVGLHGRPFVLYKFRTMGRDAEARYDDLASSSDTKGAAFTMRHDPRVTPLGALLRRSSLDELPQLWNVLRGTMSLIGPRPAPPREVAAYDVWHRRRLSMRPGITGLSQVRTRMDGHFDDRAHLDLAYIDHWSLAGDARIMGRTFSAVLNGMRRQPDA